MPYSGPASYLYGVLRWLFSTKSKYPSGLSRPSSRASGWVDSLSFCSRCLATTFFSSASSSSVFTLVRRCRKAAWASFRPPCPAGLPVVVLSVTIMHLCSVSVLQEARQLLQPAFFILFIRHSPKLTLTANIT